MSHIAWGKIDQKHQAFIPFWEKLILNSHTLVFLDKQKIKKWQEMPHGFVLRFSLNNKMKRGLIKLSLPLWWTINFCLLLLHRYRHKLDTIVLLNFTDKLLLSRPAKLLGLKIIWIFLPLSEKKSFDKKLIKQSKNIEIICFSPTCQRNLLNTGFLNEQIHLLPLGTPSKELKCQKTIFSEFAEHDKRNNLKKFFSIITIVDLDHQSGLEQLFSAIQKALTVLNNLQLVVVGEGKERQNLKWLANKKGLGNIVWFVGKQKYLSKWFSPADLFISCTKDLKLDDCWYCLKAASAKLPLILPDYPQLEDFFTDQKNALFYELNDTETLTQAIINLKQKQSLRLRLGQKAKENVDNNFNLAKMVTSFEKIIK